MGLHDLSLERVGLTDEEKAAIAYVTGLGYKFRRLSNGKFQCTNRDVVSWFDVTPENITYWTKPRYLPSFREEMVEYV